MTDPLEPTGEPPRSGNETTERSGSTDAPERPSGGADSEVAIRRVRRNAIVLSVVLALGLGLWTASLTQALGVLGAAALMLLSFQGLVLMSRRLTDPEGEGPGALQAVLLTGRYVLLGIVLYAMVLMPGVGPIPVALGLSVLVLAILLEAFIQLYTGTTDRS